LFPQHWTTPPATIAQVCWYPAVASTAPGATQATGTGTDRAVRVPSPSAAFVLSPEHCMAPSTVTTHV
jgi:hypothetical protein